MKKTSVKAAIVAAAILGMLSTAGVQADDVDLGPLGIPGWIAQVDGYLVLRSDIRNGGTTLRSGVPTIRISAFLGSGFISTPHKFTPFTDIHFVHVSGTQHFRATVEIDIFNSSLSDYAGVDIALISARLPPDAALFPDLLLKDLVNGHPRYAHIHPDNTPVSVIASLVDAPDCDSANQTAFGPSFLQANGVPNAIVPFNPVSSVECLIPGPFGATFTAPPSAFHVIQHIPAFGPGNRAIFNGLGFHQYLQGGRTSDFTLHLAAVLEEPGVVPFNVVPFVPGFDLVPGFNGRGTKPDRPNPWLDRLQEGPQPPVSKNGWLGEKLWQDAGLNKLWPSKPSMPPVDVTNPVVAEFVNRLAGTGLCSAPTPTQMAEK